MLESGRRELGLEGESLGKLTYQGWRRLEDLQQAVASLEAETSRWHEVTQVGSLEAFFGFSYKCFPCTPQGYVWMS